MAELMLEARPIPGRTSVVNVRFYRSGFVYCGRANFPRFAEESPFCNRFSVRDHGLMAGVKFVQRMHQQLRDPTWAAKQALLRGLVLGCWCMLGPGEKWKQGKSHRCHCEVHAAYVDGDLATVKAAESVAWWSTSPDPVQRSLL